jgi:hypothetical protein
MCVLNQTAVAAINDEELRRHVIAFEQGRAL